MFPQEISIFLLTHDGKILFEQIRSLIINELPRNGNYRNRGFHRYTYYFFKERDLPEELPEIFPLAFRDPTDF